MTQQTLQRLKQLETLMGMRDAVPPYRIEVWFVDADGSTEPGPVIESPPRGPGSDDRSG
jgi:hypothetical protein